MNRTSFLWIALFVFTTILYIPIIYYYYEEGNLKRAGQIVAFTVLLGIGYVVLEAFFSVGAVVNTASELRREQQENSTTQ